MGNDFPKIGINTEALIEHVNGLIAEAINDGEQHLGPVNWADLSVADVEYRLSMLDRTDGPYCVVIVEEASPDCGLRAWLNERLDKVKFPRTHIECEW